MQFIMIFDSTAGCCGVTQCHGFSDEYDEDSWYGDDPAIIGEGNDEVEAYQDLFTKLKAYNPKGNSGGRLLQIWFQKSIDYEGNFEDDYLAEPLRQLIETIPNVSNLGEYVNYKSGNKIQGYQWEQPI